MDGAADGNLTKKVSLAGVTWKYTWDNADHLTSARKYDEDPDVYGVSATLQAEVDYKYDVWGNLIERDADDNGDGVVDDTAQYVLDGWDPARGSPTGLENYDVLADLDGSGSLTTRYLHGDAVDQLFGRVDAGGGGLWYSTDHQGSVWGLVDNAGGTEVMSVQYDTFGHISLQTGSVELGRYTWTGRELDSVTGLQYNRARWYDPQAREVDQPGPDGVCGGGLESLGMSIISRQAVLIPPACGLLLI